MRGVPLHFPPATFANGDDNIRGRCRRVRCRLVSARLITYLTVLGSKSRTVRGRMVFFGPLLRSSPARTGLGAT